MAGFATIGFVEIARLIFKRVAETQGDRIALGVLGGRDTSRSAVGIARAESRVLGTVLEAEVLSGCGIGGKAEESGVAGQGSGARASDRPCGTRRRFRQDFGPDFGSDLRPRFGSDLRPRFGADLRPRFGASLRKLLGPCVRDAFGRGFGLGFGLGFRSGFGTRFGRGFGTRFGLRLGAGFGSNLGLSFKAGFGLRLGLDFCTRLGAGFDGRTHAKALTADLGGKALGVLEADDALGGSGVADGACGRAVGVLLATIRIGTDALLAKACTRTVGVIEALDAFGIQGIAFGLGCRAVFGS